MGTIVLASRRPVTLHWTGSGSAIFGIIAAMEAGILCLRLPLDSDLGWHLRAGQLLLTSHQVSQTDPFSHTMLGSPWVDNEWLWETWVAALNSGGPLTLMAANAILVAATIALVYLTLRLRRVSGPLSATGAVAASISLIPYEDVRPGMMGAFFVACFLVFLEKSRWSGDRRWLLALLPCEILWANCHGSYILGPVVCAIYALADFWERRRWRPLTQWVVLGAGLFASTLANPIGFGLLRFTVNASRLTFNRDFVQAWKAPDFNQAGFLPLLLVVLLSLALPLLWPTARVPKTGALLVLASTLAALKSNEFLPLYAVAAVPVVAQMAQAALKPPLDSKPSALSISPLLLALALLAGSRLPEFAPGAYEQAVSKYYPAQAVDFVNREGLVGPLWNDFDWGGYLISALPRLPVLVDSRTEMYGDDFLHQYLKVASGIEPPEKAFERYGIQLALIPVNSTLATELRQSTAWREMYHDDLASVFVRNTGDSVWSNFS